MTEANCVLSPMMASKALNLSVKDVIPDPKLYRSTIGAFNTLQLLGLIHLLMLISSATHWDSCKRLLCYLKGTVHHGLKIQA